MFRKSIINQFFATFFCLILVSNEVFAAAMSQKLWGGLKKSDVQNLKELSVAVDKDNYKKALEVAKQMNESEASNKSSFSDAVMKIALWNKYSQVDDEKFDVQNVAFSDISRFVNDGQFFPNFSELRKNAEKVAIANNIPYNFSKQYFQNFPATDADSKIYLLKSEITHANLATSNNPKENIQKDISDLTVNIWVNENFTADKEEKFLLNYGTKLTEENHSARITRLLWDNKIEEARRIFYLVSPDHQILFNAIIQMGKDSKNIDKILATVPRDLRGNELLAYKVIMWQKSQVGNGVDVDDVVEMLMAIPSTVRNPNKWWSLRKLYSREMLKSKDYKEAYIIASSHGLRADDKDFADAEWTAGWIALRFLDKPKVAYEHFNKLYLNVNHPMSVSRAAYWLGMASIDSGEKAKAIEWYKVAAKYPTYFYGQLAIHKRRVLDSVGAQNDIILPQDPQVLDSDIKSMANNDALKIAYILALIGDKKNSTKIFEYVVANSKTDGEIAVVMKVVNEMKDKELDVKVSRAAARKNVFFIKDKFQIVKEIENDSHAPLVHAIIKQESGFTPSALSSVGAIGFMQLMPGTAQLVCKQIGLKYNKRKLATDMNYNVALGSFYIKSLIDDFDGSELLAIASYNAGPGAAKRWVNDFYDPRKTKDIDKVVDWIELITYSETRNYVQRIMENLIVYKYLMSRTNYDDIK